MKDGTTSLALGPALLGGLAALCLASCQSVDTRHHVVVSVADQKLVLLDSGRVAGNYRVSTSRYGLGDWRWSYRTPVGKLAVAKKIGGRCPSGAVLKSRQWNGEILPPNAPGRDPVVSRILWLRGREARNRNAFGRMIYIHGTTEERNLGRPASFGCVRMRSQDVIDLYGRVRVGTPVTILPGHLPMAVHTAWLNGRSKPSAQLAAPAAAPRAPAPPKVADARKPQPAHARRDKG